jgi:hypothetical protein
VVGLGGLGREPGKAQGKGDGQRDEGWKSRSEACLAVSLCSKNAMVLMLELEVTVPSQEERATILLWGEGWHTEADGHEDGEDEVEAD